MVFSTRPRPLPARQWLSSTRWLAYGWHLGFAGSLGASLGLSMFNAVAEANLFMSNNLTDVLAVALPVAGGIMGIVSAGVRAVGLATGITTSLSTLNRELAY